MKLTIQETSDITLACETLMEQLYDDIGSIDNNERYYRLWDLRDKLKKNVK